MRVLTSEVFPSPPTRPARVGQRAVGQPPLRRPLVPVLRRARDHDVFRCDPLAQRVVTSVPKQPRLRERVHTVHHREREPVRDDHAPRRVPEPAVAAAVRALALGPARNRAGPPQALTARHRGHLGPVAREHPRVRDPDRDCRKAGVIQPPYRHPLPHSRQRPTPRPPPSRQRPWPPRAGSRACWPPRRSPRASRRSRVRLSYADLVAAPLDGFAQGHALDRRHLAQSVPGPLLGCCHRSVPLTDRSHHLHSQVFQPLGPFQECSASLRRHGSRVTSGLLTHRLLAHLLIPHSCR
nr:hypothetical protein [Nocardioides sp. JS614]